MVGGAPVIEGKICGHREKDWETGLWHECRLPPHGPRTRHGNLAVVEE